jgi:uncharacterized membrane protein
MFLPAASATIASIVLLVSKLVYSPASGVYITVVALDAAHVEGHIHLFGTRPGERRLVFVGFVASGFS